MDGLKRGCFTLVELWQYLERGEKEQALFAHVVNCDECAARVQRFRTGNISTFDDVFHFFLPRAVEPKVKS